MHLASRIVEQCGHCGTRRESQVSGAQARIESDCRSPHLGIVHVNLVQCPVIAPVDAINVAHHTDCVAILGHVKEQTEMCERSRMFLEKMKWKKEWSALGILLGTTLISLFNVICTAYYVAFKGISELQIAESVVSRGAKHLKSDEIMCYGSNFVYVGRNQIFLMDFPDIIETSTLRSKPTSDFEISSLNKVSMFGPKKAKIHSLGGSVDISAMDQIELNSLNEIHLRSAKIYMPVTKVNRTRRRGRSGYQLCTCENGLVFASVNDHPCSSDYQVCETDAPQSSPNYRRSHSALSKYLAWANFPNLFHFSPISLQISGN
eukprot:maker-scaffold96_size378025-snap-gene-2.38 protein:Tk04979 transcript:maker-scaffold96_size378025-snap-gene-2.38-mRNA-1 annotation:"Delta-sarcoglycan"